MGCFRQVRQEIFYKKKIANKTTRQKIKTIRRMRRSVDRMSEEKRVLREAEVAKEKEFFNSQIQIVSNAECQKMFTGIYKIDPTYICGYSPGFHLLFSRVRLPFRKSYTSQVLTLARVTQGVLYPLLKEEGKPR